MKRWFPLTLSALAVSLLLDLFCRGCLPRPVLTVTEPALPAPRAQDTLPDSPQGGGTRSESSAPPAPEEASAAREGASPCPDPAGTASVPASPGGDALCVFPVLFDDGEYRELSMADFLPGVVAAEMPASFEPEALCAQAVAARTYIRCRMEQSSLHGAAAVCTDPGCCQAWKSEAELRADWGENYERFREKIEAAVHRTDGVLLTWEGSPILSCFHSSSPGQTESSAAVWKGALPYLVSVSSPEGEGDVPDYVTVTDISPEELAAALSTLRPGFRPDGDPALWAGSIVTDEAKRVRSVSFGGESFGGEALRGALGLRSAAFSVKWTGECFRFTVTGFGHGVGMSQYGAQVMAQRGAGWREIVMHYYPGAEISEG